MEPSLLDRKALILGGMGFVGSNLAIRLVSLGAKVTIVDSMLPQYGGNLLNILPIEGQCRINFSDIRDSFSLDYLVRDTDFIFSVAGQTSHIASMTDPMTDLDINCRSQLSLLNVCTRCDFAYASVTVSHFMTLAGTVLNSACWGADAEIAT